MQGLPSLPLSSSLVFVGEGGHCSTLTDIYTVQQLLAYFLLCIKIPNKEATAKASNVNRGWVKRLWVRKRNPAVRFACRLH